MVCDGCRWRGRGVVAVPNFSRSEGWEYKRVNTAFPPCDLEPELFTEFMFLRNFAGRILSLTSHEGKKDDAPVSHQYGTEGITIPRGTCVGRSARE